MLRLTRPVVVLSVLLCLSLMGCGEDPPPQPPQPAGPAASRPAPPPQPARPAAVDEAPASNAWPYLGKDFKVPVAENLLTRNFVLVFDGSGSMGEKGCSGEMTKIEAAKIAVRQWSAILPADANLGLVTFHARSSGIAVHEMADGRRERFAEAINAVQPGGGTPLTNALQQAFWLLEKQAQRQLGYGEYTIVVVTDGIANQPERLSMLVKLLLRDTPINIFTIGFCIGQNHSLNQKGHTEYRAAGNPEELRRGLAEALAETESFDAVSFQQD